MWTATHGHIGLSLVTAGLAKLAVSNDDDPLSHESSAKEDIVLATPTYISRTVLSQSQEHRPYLWI